LLCINGTGILNRWLKGLAGSGSDYASLNRAAGSIAPGSEGLVILPFGNGAERILHNRIIGAQIHNIDLNKHEPAHLYRAGQEGIAFAFRYGLDIMRENGMSPSVIRAGKANMFLSPVFAEAFVEATNTPVELYDCDGSVGAALGAGIGAGIFPSGKEAFRDRKALQLIRPRNAAEYDELYGRWKEVLERAL
jgi:xylulokinase